MFISRRKYENDIREAVEKAISEANNRYWQRDEIRCLQDQINNLSERVRKLEPKDGGSNCREDVCVPVFR